jgi:hypothetical protein
MIFNFLLPRYFAGSCSTGKSDVFMKVLDKARLPLLDVCILRISPGDQESALKSDRAAHFHEIFIQGVLLFRRQLTTSHVIVLFLKPALLRNLQFFIPILLKSCR